jgi:predicted small lipoprotein YifL
MRNLAPSLAALLLPLSLAACGSDGSDDVVADPAPTSSPTSASPSAPTASPTVGTYPAFAPTDYTFELTVSCFCMTSGVPILVTVVDSQVADAVYGAAEGGRGGTQEGEPADEGLRMTIDDVIEAANDTDADRVSVDWPAGQDYPTSVFVDGETNVADDEVGYGITDVVLS